VEVALEAERGFVGVSCGILDPYAISFARVGQVLWLETRQGRHEHLPLDTGSVRLVLVDSGTRRSLASGEYNSRVEECERALAVLRSCGVVEECLADVSSSQLREHAGSLDRVLYRRVQHVVGEVERTRAARSALLCGDLVRVGGLMRETQDSLRELFEVSVPALDRLIARALEVGGVHGGRLVGAGFGGCAAFLVEQHAVSALEQVVRQANRTPCGEASGIWVLDSAEGPREH
jgi:galactokinase